MYIIVAQSMVSGAQDSHWNSRFSRAGSFSEKARFVCNQLLRLPNRRRERRGELQQASMAAKGWRSSWSWAEEEAKRELELLESLHPGRFDFLKLELKAFISDDSQLHPPPSDDACVSTQGGTFSTFSFRVEIVSHTFLSLHRAVSSNGKKRKVSYGGDAMAKAEACLRRIREIKRSFVHGRRPACPLHQTRKQSKSEGHH